MLLGRRPHAGEDLFSQILAIEYQQMDHFLGHDQIHQYPQVLPQSKRRIHLQSVHPRIYGNAPTEVRQSCMSRPQRAYVTGKEAILIRKIEEIR